MSETRLVVGKTEQIAYALERTAMSTPLRKYTFDTRSEVGHPPSCRTCFEFYKAADVDALLQQREEATAAAIEQARAQERTFWKRQVDAINQALPDFVQADGPPATRILMLERMWRDAVEQLASLKGQP